MERLNYQHLLYFWLTAREGSVTKAAALLGLAQPTLSGQIRTLESVLGERLFEKRGRRLQLTEAGHMAFEFAGEIFARGDELMETLKRRPTLKPATLSIGLSDVVTKPVAHRLIEPLLAGPDPVRVVVREDAPPVLLAALVERTLDVVLLDEPPGPGADVRLVSQLLGESDVVLVATPALARRHRARYPQSLDGAPFLLPGLSSGLRRSLEEWFDRHRIRPHVAGEFDDSALGLVFGEGGSGLLAIPSVVERDVRTRYGLVRVGPVEGAKEQLFAISLPRRFGHPALARLTERARSGLFAADARPPHRGRAPRPLG